MLFSKYIYNSRLPLPSIMKLCKRVFIVKNSSKENNTYFVFRLHFSNKSVPKTNKH